MISVEKRRAVFLFHKEGKGSRWIARAVGLARSSVQQILKEGPEPPDRPPRSRKLDGRRERIEELYNQCERNLARVAEELEQETTVPTVAYSTLTDFCRHYQMGQPREDKQPTGQYAFGPAVEQQHDTSLMEIVVGGKLRNYQATSMKLGYSKNRYLRFYRRFRRFECKDFHNHSAPFLGGSCQREVIDNTSVVVVHGTGKNAVMAPEMETFAQKYGFKFLAHELRDSNRKAKVERDFRYIRSNFLAKRTFTDDEDLNRQAEEWCRKKNNTGYDKKRRVLLRRLYEEEKAHLLPLPAYRPPACQWHFHRRVDPEGMVCLDGNRYSAPNAYLGKEVTLKETMETVTLMDGPTELCIHRRIPDGDRGESRLAGHGRDLYRRRMASARMASEEERWLEAQSPVLADYVKGLKRLGSRRFPSQLRRLYALCHDFEVSQVIEAARLAAQYDLFDVTRLEKMLLNQYGARLFAFRHDPSGGGSGAVTPVVSAPSPTMPFNEDESGKNGGRSDRGSEGGEEGHGA
jgi:transposase